MQTETDYMKLPSSETWAELYKKAMEFKSIKPWEWMYDTDLFGVQEQIDDTIGYCCVLGNAGEVFGLTVYIGTEGLNSYLKVLHRDSDEELDHIMHEKKCLLLTFEDKKYLDQEDLEIIKKINLEVKGKNAWLQCRSYMPGYYPWHINDKEAEFLINCLSQAIDTALRFKQNPNLFEDDEGRYLVRVRDENKKWTDRWLEPSPFHDIFVMQKEIDKKRIEDIINKSSRQKQIWEIDYFYTPMYVAEKNKRPYFPINILFVDHNSYYILDTHLTTRDKYRMEFFEQFLSCIEKINILPEKIWVRKKEAFALLEQITGLLGIKLNLVEQLRAVDDVFKSMNEHFNKGHRRYR